MAKTTPLTAEYMDTASAVAPLPVRPLAGTVSKRPPKAPRNDGIIQIRCTKEQEKAIKKAAVDADKSISSYVLDCLKI
jgi:hypothetical protein